VLVWEKPKADKQRPTAVTFNTARHQPGVHRQENTKIRKRWGGTKEGEKVDILHEGKRTSNRSNGKSKKEKLRDEQRKGGAMRKTSWGLIPRGKNTEEKGGILVDPPQSNASNPRRRKGPMLDT